MFKKALFIGLSGALLISLSSTAFAADGSSMRAELGIGVPQHHHHMDQTGFNTHTTVMFLTISI